MGRDSDDGCHRIDVSNYDGPGADDCVESDSDALYDGRSDADERSAFDGDMSGKLHARANMDGSADHGFVIDDAAGVENYVVADLAMRANNRAGRDYHSLSDRGTGGDVG